MINKYPRKSCYWSDHIWFTSLTATRAIVSGDVGHYEPRLAWLYLVHTASNKDCDHRERSEPNMLTDFT